MTQLISNLYIENCSRNVCCLNIGRESVWNGKSDFWSQFWQLLSLDLFFKQKFSYDISLGATELHMKLFYIQNMKLGPFTMDLTYVLILTNPQEEVKWWLLFCDLTLDKSITIYVCIACSIFYYIFSFVIWWHCWLSFQHIVKLKYETKSYRSNWKLMEI